MRKLIRLWAMPGEVMLVISQPTGVFYQNQVGGNACMQAELEGVLAPLDMDEAVHQQLMALFDPFARQGISTATADVIDSILASQPAAKNLRVDRRRLEASCEAWVYVILESGPSLGADHNAGMWLGFGTSEGVLTWPNSD